MANSIRRIAIGIYLMGIIWGVLTVTAIYILANMHDLEGYILAPINAVIVLFGYWAYWGMVGSGLKLVKLEGRLEGMEINDAFSRFEEDRKKKKRSKNGKK